MPQQIELLAPARNADIAISAIDHGADAIYIGASAHGARKMASNPLEEIARVVNYAHIFNVKVYVTVNTIVYDDELQEVERLVWNLYRIGVDALIVQDMALLRMHLPPIALHASTQCDIRTPEKARFLQDAGFSQLVLPRELNMQEIQAMRQAVTVPLEVFVHGALCVSYSGDCQASFLSTGRSANRGECAQICRYAFNLEDDKGNVLVRNKHLLSLKDMNRIDMLADLLKAGASSFKIEGRLKDEAYVKNVVAAYSDALDRIIDANPGKWVRASRGKSTRTFRPDLYKSFNRNYTGYLFGRPKSDEKIATFNSPKWTGEKVATVISLPTSRKVKVRAMTELHNGDGLGYFNKSGEFVGFRLNRIDGNLLNTATDIDVTPGTELYRNNDKAWNDTLETKGTATRTIEVSIRLRTAASQLIIDITDANGTGISVSTHIEAVEAKTDQHANRARILTKLGDTPYVATNITDETGNLFIPASVLTNLRRQATDALTDTYRATHAFHRRPLTKQVSPKLPASYELSRHDNIANRLAADFYAEASTTPHASPLPRAVEADNTVVAKEMRVMQTRYCLRNEMGACLRKENATKLPAKLFLTSGQLLFRLDFDCRNCLMNIIKVQ